MAGSEALSQASEDEIRQQLAVQQFSAAQREVQSLATRIAEMEMRSTEIEQVLEIVKSVPKDRRTWYNVDGVLVEMTADSIIPRLMDTKAHLHKQIDDLSKDVDKKKDMLAEFAIKQKLVVPVYKKDAEKKSDK